MYYSKLLSNNFNNIAIKFKNRFSRSKYTVNNISAKYVNDS